MVDQPPSAANAQGAAALLSVPASMPSGRAFSTSYPLSTVHVAIARDAPAFEALAPQWRALAERAADASASQTFDYSWAAWHALGMPSGLAVISIHRDDTLCAIWPLRLVREGGATCVRHLGCGSNEEYAGPLIAEPAAPDVIEALAAAALHLGDVLQAFALDPGSPIREHLTTHRLIYRSAIRSPELQALGATDFEGWIARKSASFRKGLRYDRRRLAQQGELVFALERGEAGAETVDWLWAEKRAWLDRRGVKTNWLREPVGHEMFRRLASATREPAPLDIVAFSLRLDSEPVAACICAWSRNRLEYLVTGYHRTYEKFSVGNLLVEDCVRWAMAHRLAFDFRVTEDAYKLRWADARVARETVFVACTVRGVAWVAKAHQRRAWYNVRRLLGGLRRNLVARGKSPPERTESTSRSLRALGALATAGQSVWGLVGKLRRRALILRRDIAQIAEDHALRVDTHLMFPRTPPEPGQLYSRYEPLSYAALRRIRRELGSIEGATLVDVGCGLGRVVCVFARERLKRVIGIELDPELASECNRNVSRLRSRQSEVEIICGDAVEQDYDQAGIIYLYNPFRGPVMSRFLEALTKSLARRPRRLTLVYANPVELPAVQAAGFGEPTRVFDVPYGAGICQVAIWHTPEGAVTPPE